MVLTIPTLKSAVDRQLAIVGVLQSSVLLKYTLHGNGIVRIGYCLVVCLDVSQFDERMYVALELLWDVCTIMTVLQR